MTSTSNLKPFEKSPLAIVPTMRRGCSSPVAAAAVPKQRMEGKRTPGTAVTDPERKRHSSQHIPELTSLPSLSPFIIDNGKASESW